ncbi:arsenic transporter [Fictibacillus barbaricus]|uniref:Arsenical pump membrane protein n=1 Tax=Fictibacillus barbaricus TaxID=182136 RepID=A0ABU1TVA2_9BACL|nr:arsenic transporter [Fictibacillus barbaricus]MDR7071087.1 arsenical pump membrane protein [Fictibacillus barbaricus]
MNFPILISVFVFLMTMLVIFWRPKGINEAWPAAIGAGIILITGVVSFNDVIDVIQKIGGASITIMSTIVMAVILESFGFFHWAATRLAKLAKGSGYRLYWYIQLFCFLMTLLFNNDGSILITTPILILLLRNFRLKPHQKIPYLLTGALIATASSTPIGVSNIVNLIALKIVHMTLYMHTAMMFIPAMLGLVFMSILMFFLVKQKLPKKLPDLTNDIEQSFFRKNFHPLKEKVTVTTKKQRTAFMLKIILFVFFIRCSIFAASFLSIPIEIVAVLGSLILLLWRWYYLRTSPYDILKKTPWHILIFAFSMYVIIYGLHNSGLTVILLKICKPIVEQGLFQATFLMGGLVSILSNFFNNHPALLIGTITLTELHLDPVNLKTMYLASIIGSDIGSLLLPIGTLASLIWMHILKQHKIKVKWKDYLKVSLIAIPLTLLVTLFLLYHWINLIIL